VKTTGEVVTATGRAKVERIAAAEIPIRRRGGGSRWGRWRRACRWSGSSAARTAATAVPAPAWMRASPRRKRFDEIGRRAISLRSAAARRRELGVGVVKDDVDLKAHIERVALEGRESHVDLLSRCAPGVSDDDEIVVTSSLTSPNVDQHWAFGL
jgi:hypothetical protein